MSRVIDPKLFAEALCKFHAAWLIVDTWNVVGLAVIKVILQPPLTGRAEVVRKDPIPSSPRTSGRQGAQLVKGFFGCLGYQWPTEVPPFFW